MTREELPIAETEAGERLDKLVARRLGISRAATKRLFDEGKVKSGRRTADKGELAVAGRTIVVEAPEVKDDAGAVPDPTVELSVLLERPDVVVVDKPAGLPCAPLRGGELGTLANGIVARFPETAGIGYHAREPGLVHRLDNDTSGVVVVARTKPAWDALVLATKRGQLDKRYLAVVHDEDMPEEGTVDTPLAPHPKDKRRVLACLHPRDIAREKPRPAETSYRVLHREKGLAVVLVKAPRALRHQVRAHLAVLECPIVGDVLYGAPARPGLSRHALHASGVTYGGSKDAPAFAVESPLPAELRALVPGYVA